MSAPVPAAPPDGGPYRVYRRRWLYLFVIVTAQVTNETAWLSFSPVANYVANYYDHGLSDINLQMTIFMVIHFFVTPFVIWAADNWSFRWVLVIGAVLNGLGMAVKGVSTWDAVTPVDLRYTITLLGSILVAVSQPFTMMIPTRFSQTWHPPNERTFTTALASLAAPVGGLLGLSATPLYVKEPSDVPLINTIWVFPALVSAVVAVLGITRSSPPTPPSASAAARPGRRPFLATLRDIFTNRAVLCLMVCFGTAIGILNCIVTLLGQLLCPRGYTPEFVGLCGALLFGWGIPGAALLSFMAMKTGKVTEIVKVSFAIICISLIIFCQALRYHSMPWLVGVSVSAIGFLGVGLYPLILELGVEASYPADQTYSSSLLFLPGSILGAVLVAVSSALGRHLPAADEVYETCSAGGAAGVVQAVDYTYFFMFITAIDVLCASGFILFFETPYHRSNRDVGAAKASLELVSRAQEGCGQPPEAAVEIEDASVTDHDCREP